MNHLLRPARTLLLLLAFAASAHAQTGLTRLGEFKVNTTTASSQEYPTVAGDASGRFVVTWQSLGQDGDQLGIYAQVYNAAASPVGPEFRVNTITDFAQGQPQVAMRRSTGEFVVVWIRATSASATEYRVSARRFNGDGTAKDPNEIQIPVPPNGVMDQREPRVAMDANGNFVVVWTGFGQDGDPANKANIYFQRYDATGVPQQSGRVNTSATDHQRTPGVAMEPDGDFAVVWQHETASPSPEIRARRFTAAGAPRDAQDLTVSLPGSDPSYASVGVADDGRMVVIWNSTSGEDGDNTGILARRYPATGAPTAQFVVNSFTASVQQLAGIAVAPNGDFTAAWRSFGIDGNGTGVACRRFLADGTPLGPDFIANTSTTGDQQPNSGGGGGAVALDASGNVVVVWDDHFGFDGDGIGVFADKFFVDGSGPPLTEFRVNTTTAGDQLLPTVAMNASGNAVVVWETPGNGGVGLQIYFQRYQPNGFRVGTEQPVTLSPLNSQRKPAVAMDNAGNFVVAWQGGAANGTNNDIYGQRFDADGTRVGTVFPVNTTTGDEQVTPSIAMEPSGRFVIAWASNGQDGDGYGIYLQRFDQNGPTGVESRVNALNTIGTQIIPFVGMNANGAFVVTWQGFNGSFSWDIYAACFDAQFQPLSTDFRVNTNQTGAQVLASAGIAADGSFIVAWGSDAIGAAGSQVVAQRFSGPNTFMNGEIPVNATASGDQEAPFVVMRGTGEWAAIWQSAGQDASGIGIYSRRFSTSDVALSGEILVNVTTAGDQSFVVAGFVGSQRLAFDSVGNYFAVWHSQNQDGSGHGVYATKVFLYPEATVATVAASQITDTGAKLNGTVNAQGDSAAVSFDYGPTAALGTTVSAGTVTGTTDTPVSTTLAGLLPGQTVFFRVRAVSSGREVVGPTLSFNTLVLPPVVSLPVQTAQGLTTASLEVTVNPKGAPTTVLLEYRLEPPLNAGDPFTQTTAQNCGSGLADVVKTFNLTGLTASRTYKVRAIATNSAGPTQSADATFTTTGAPGVVTGGNINVTKTGATLQGTVNPFGAAATASFQYGTTTGYGQSTPVQPVGSGNTATAYEATISGLMPNTLYHYRLVATNGGGTTPGADGTLTTQPDPPIAATAPPAAVSGTGATLQGAVNPNTRATDYFFQWGTTTLYGNVTPTQSLTAGTTAVNVSAMLTGVLTQGGTYHYRLVAMNVAGTAFGGDESFVAMTGGGGGGPSGPPTITSPESNSVGQTSATLTAMVNPNGGSTSVRFQYGTTIAYGSTSDVATINGTSDLNVSIPITGLSPATQYFFRVDATNSANTSMLVGMPFTTANPPAPMVANLAPGNIQQTTATVSANVTANGGPTTVKFKYGVDAGPMTDYTGQTTTENLLASAANQQVSRDLTGLTAGTIYRFRAVATNAGGNTMPEATFTTQPPPPTVVATPPTGGDLGATFATLRGTVNPNGRATTGIAFEYGPTTSYGTTVAVSATFADSTAHPVVKSLTGLVPGTIYHFRLNASSAQGSTLGDDAMFTTLPPQDPTAAPDVMFTDLESQGKINVVLNDTNNDTGLTGAAAGLSVDAITQPAAHGLASPGPGADEVSFEPNTASPIQPGQTDTFQYRVRTTNGRTANGTVTVAPFVNLKGTYFGVLQPPPGSAVSDGGTLTVTLASAGSGKASGRLLWLGKPYTFKTTFAADGTAAFQKPKSATPGSPFLRGQLQLTLDDGGQITARLQDDDTGRVFPDNLLTLTGATPAGAQRLEPGAHTAFIDPPDDAPFAADGNVIAGQLPGAGFLGALVKSRKTFNARFAGRVSDAEPFSAGVLPTAAGYPVYDPKMYKKGRTFNGQVLATVQPGVSSLRWDKEDGVGIPNSGEYHLPGLNLVVGQFAGPNVNPLDRIISFLGGADTNGGHDARVEISGGDMTGTKQATLRFSRRAVKVLPTTTPELPDLKFGVTAFGTFFGSFTLPADSAANAGQKQKFYGTFREDNPSFPGPPGRGHFRGSTKGGKVEVRGL